MNKVCYNFLVCRALHEQRTLPLFEYHSKHVDKQDTFYLGGFDTFDNVPITKVSKEDNYYSCIDKTFAVFTKHEKFDWDWCFIGDDDTFINYSNLQNLIETLPVSTLVMYGYVDLAPTTYGSIPHVHGGSGLLFNKNVFYKFREFLLNTNFSIKHHLHSDVTLAMNIHEYNLRHSNPILFKKIDNMLSPHVEVSTIDFNKCVTFHMKDKIDIPNILKLIETPLHEN